MNINCFFCFRLSFKSSFILCLPRNSFLFYYFSIRSSKLKPKYTIFRNMFQLALMLRKCVRVCCSLIGLNILHFATKVEWQISSDKTTHWKNACKNVSYRWLYFISFFFNYTFSRTFSVSPTLSLSFSRAFVYSEKIKPRYKMFLTIMTISFLSFFLLFIVVELVVLF